MLKVYACALVISLVYLFIGCKKEDSTPTPPAKSSEKVITEFKFLKSLNAELDADYTGKYAKGRKIHHCHFISYTTNSPDKTLHPLLLHSPIPALRSASVGG